jgi:hypothetical protein
MVSSDVDDDALRRALEIARRDPQCAALFDAKLADGEPWCDVAESAAYHCQIKALRLRPWQEPPAVADATDPRERDPEAQALLRRMLAAGLSRYEPDPMAALFSTTRPRKGTPEPTGRVNCHTNCHRTAKDWTG